jgi:hypothetical protein
VGEVLIVEVPERPGIPGGLRLQAQVISADRARILGDWVFGCALVRCGLSGAEAEILAGGVVSGSEGAPLSLS